MEACDGAVTGLTSRGLSQGGLEFLMRAGDQREAEQGPGQHGTSKERPRFVLYSNLESRPPLPL